MGALIFSAIAAGHWEASSGRIGRRYTITHASELARPFVCEVQDWQSRKTIRHEHCVTLLQAKSWLRRAHFEDWRQLVGTEEVSCQPAR